MKPTLRSAMILLFCTCTCTFISNAQITGTVFRDFNGNGTRQTAAGYSEPGVGGVIIRAYNSSDLLIATQTSSSVTASLGQYSFPATGLNSVSNGTAVRLEFIIPASGVCGLSSTYDFASGSGATHGTAVRFLSGGAASININFAINDPNDYIGDAAPFSNTTFFVNRYHSGNATGAGTSAAGGVFYKMSYAIKGSTSLPASNLLALNSQIGTCYGVAYSKQANRVFTSAFLKRHNGLGPANGTFNNAPGAIYIINPNLTSSTGAASYFTSLDALGAATHNSTGSPAFGTPAAYSITGTGYGATISYTATGAGGLGIIGTNAQRGLPDDSTVRSTDPTAFGQVGKVSLGDMEISDDGQYLFVTNFYDRKLYQLQLNSITNPTSATLVNSWSLPNPPLRSASGLTNASSTYTGANNGTNFYDGTRGLQRPFALKYYRGKVYVGAVTTGEGTSAVNTLENNANGVPEYTDLWAYVWEFNPSTGTFAAAPTLQTPLNFDRGTNSDGQSERWKPWTNTVPSPWTGSAPGFSQYQQPMFSGIEFDADGTMILGFRDRFGDQSGYDQSGINGAVRFAGQAMGDLYRAYYNLSTCTYEMEQNAKEGPGSSKAATAGINNGDGPSNYTTNNGEFYYRDEVYNGNTATSVGTFHLNTTSGALAIIKGTDSVAVTTMDPLRAWSSGISWFGNTGGDNGRDYEMFAGAGTGTFPIPVAGAVGKANGLGDIELLTSVAPIEIGNRIWNDTNGDGVQNAGEAGIANVSLEIFADFDNDGVPDGAALGSTATNASGEWYFNTGNITDGDPSVAGNQAGPAAGKRYLVRVATADWTAGAGVNDLLNYRLTGLNITGNGQAGFSDNDADIENNIPTIRVLTGSSGVNNHNLDFGFKQLGSIGNRVWLDSDADGTQDETSPGSGIYIEPGLAGITITLFRDNNNDGDFLDAGELNATTVTDAYGNYLFNNLTTGVNAYRIVVTPPANYTFTTQTNAAQDVATDATGSDVNATTGISYNITLTTGELENDIDAGLIFSQAVTQSIGNKIFFDTNNNGVDNNEPGIAGVVVSLYRDNNTDGDLADAGENIPYATTITDANGNYNFISLPTGNYQVGTTLPAGFTYASYNTGGGTTGDPAESDTDSDIQTAIAGFGKTTILNISTGENLINVDGGLIATASTTASVGDFVWNDLDHDGVQDVGEPGVAGVTVTLYAADGITVLKSMETDAFGGYMFTNLTGGTSYVIGVTAVAGYTVSPANATNDITDSDISIATLKTGTFNLVAGVRNTSFDAGLYLTAPLGTARLGDKVWFDNGIGGGTAADGIQNGTEPGIGGVMVTLYRNGIDGLAGTADDVILATTATDANGNYQFVNLAASAGASTEYNVGFSNLPPGYSFTPIWVSNDANATNSDVNPGTGRTGTINLSAAESEQDVDAGLVAGVSPGKGSIGNKVFYDLDGDGIQDAGETGVAGVTITLQQDLNNDGDFADPGEATVATQSTNSLGEYLFTGLDAGSYRIQFSNGPSGYNISPANAGSNDNADSDGSNAGSAISSTASLTGTINLATGEDNLSNDLGIVKTSGTTGSISDRVWFDINNDGDRDATEPGIAGVTVTLYDASGTVLAVTVTDANGYYLFDNLTAKTTTTDFYQIAFSNYPAGLISTTPAVVITNDLSNANGAGKTQIINLNASQNRTDIDFGLTSTRASLGNFVWIDTDGDGVQDAGEAGIAGVTVTLYFDANSDGDFVDAGENIASMITDQNGQYLFTNLSAGNYQATFTTVPSGLNFTIQNTPGDNGDNTNNDANASGTTGTIALTPREADLTIDAGLYKPTATVGNYLWADNNSNNIQDVNDQGVAGVLVTLYTSGGVAVSTIVTDKNGQYLFANVAPGNYYVGFTNTPNGSLFVTPDQGGNDALDSDVNNSNGSGTTATFSVPQATVNISIDAGLLYSQALPIRLQFSAYKRNTSSELIWKVSGDIADAKNYTIERSADGIHYTAVISIPASNSTAYQQFDLVPLAGINYYRVRIEFINGNKEYSEIRIVRFGKDGLVTVFPNPATGHVNISLPDNWQGKKISIEVINQLGQIVIHKSQSQAAQVETINVSMLTGGIYNVKIVNGDNESSNKKIQVVH